MSSSENLFTDLERRQLLSFACRAVDYAVRNEAPLTVALEKFPPRFRELGASFVTLKQGGQLRGCTGMIQAVRPLIEDIASNAYSTCFLDRRFPAMTVPELEGLDVSLSILTAPEPLEYEDENDLLQKMRPGIDGLIIQYGPHHGTFLPVMWEQIPDAKDFLMHLKHKAGLDPFFWSNDIEVLRYTAEHIP